MTEPTSGSDRLLRMHVAVILAAVAVVVAAVALVTSRDRPFVSLRQELRAQARGVEPYAGLGTWVDVYDERAWADPAAAVGEMRARGVRTIYLQTSNYTRPSAIVFPNGVGRFIDAAHANGIAVVAWYLPGFVDVQSDLERVMAAIDFRSTSGRGFDSFGLDIEAPKVKPPSLRSSRLLELSRRIRGAVGPDYPLGAIVPSPLGVQSNPDYWPGFPYRSLAASYDVFLPMSYFTWRSDTPREAFDYITGNVRIIREQTGDASVPIHVIGGLANQATTGETRAFVKAVRGARVEGASYYAFGGTTNGQWRQLERLRG